MPSPSLFGELRLQRFVKQADRGFMVANLVNKFQRSIAAKLGFPLLEDL
jgi:hypothetical protein